MTTSIDPRLQLFLMAVGLRIAVADDESEMLDYLGRILPLLGHQVVAAAKDGAELVKLALAAKPDLVITDIRMPELDGIAAAAQIAAQHLVPMVLISGYHEEETIRQAKEDHVLAYLVKPVKRADLDAAIAVAHRRFREFQALRGEADTQQQALSNRRVIEQAKGILMRDGGLDEPAAFARLQTEANDHNRKLIEVAQSILTFADGSSPSDD